uniref:Uncharacterized protein n=1 Tax=Acrobeloides nanus TaxID=290746 RepID=A0A914C9V0_9BILA
MTVRTNLNMKLLYFLFICCTCSSGFAQTVSPACTTGTYDIVFVVDESGSVGASNFNLTINSIISFVQQLTIGPNDSHVGLLFFNTLASPIFSLTAYTDKKLLVNAIQQAATKYTGGGTNIASGMNGAINSVFATSGRKNVDRFMIVMTDGYDNSDVVSAHDSAYKNNIKIIAIGIGTSYDMNELILIAGSKQNVLTTSSFSNINNVLGVVCEIMGRSDWPDVDETEPPHTQPPPPPGTTPDYSTDLSNADGSPCNCNKPTLWLDLILLIDTSSSISFGGVGAIGASLNSLLRDTTLAQQGDFTMRVGIVLLNSKSQIIANLTTIQNNGDLADILHSLEQYHDLSDPTVDLYDALYVANKMFVRESNTPLRNARKTVIIVSSTYNNVDGNDPATIAHQMNQTNVFIISVCYNDPHGADCTGLSQISTPFMNFTSTDGTISDDTLDELDDALCYANCACGELQFSQMITYNSTTGRQTYYADCFAGFTFTSVEEDAKYACQEIGGALVAITSQTKSDTVIRAVANKSPQNYNHFHIGLHRNAKKEWVWYNYNNTQDIGLGQYQNWVPGFGVNSTGDCIYMDKYTGTNFGWMTESCTSQRLTYICQIRACDSTYLCPRQSWLQHQEVTQIKH